MNICQSLISSLASSHQVWLQRICRQQHHVSVRPYEYDETIPESVQKFTEIDSHLRFLVRGWKFVTYIQLEDFMIVRGYTFFIVILYIAIALLFIALGLCIYVGYSFQLNRFDFVWWVSNKYPDVGLAMYSLILSDVARPWSPFEDHRSLYLGHC